MSAPRVRLTQVADRMGVNFGDLFGAICAADCGALIDDRLTVSENTAVVLQAAAGFFGGTTKPYRPEREVA